MTQLDAAERAEVLADAKREYIMDKGYTVLAEHRFKVRLRRAGFTDREIEEELRSL
jgi:hypothetical protein